MNVPGTIDPKVILGFAISIRSRGIKIPVHRSSISAEPPDLDRAGQWTRKRRGLSRERRGTLVDLNSGYRRWNPVHISCPSSRVTPYRFYLPARATRADLPAREWLRADLARAIASIIPLSLTDAAPHGRNVCFRNDEALSGDPMLLPVHAL